MLHKVLSVSLSLYPSSDFSGQTHQQLELLSISWHQAGWNVHQFFSYSTDQSAYGIYENGVCTKTVTDLLDIPFDDFVTFYIGSSSSFELALQDAGLPVRQLESGRKAPTYQTRVLTVKSGPFSGTVGMSLRPMPRNLVERAAQVTAVLDKVHGAPIHIGHPSWIGVEDLQNPEFDDKPYMKEGDVCMFWACGVTAATAIANASRWPKIFLHYQPLDVVDVLFRLKY